MTIRITIIIVVVVCIQRRIVGASPTVGNS